MESMIRDIGLAASGQKKIDWVKGHMPLLNYFNEKYAPTQLFKGINMVVTIHLEAKTAYLALTLKNCGANVTVTGSNPLSHRTMWRLPWWLMVSPCLLLTAAITKSTICI